MTNPYSFKNMISKCFEDPRGTIPILNGDSMIKKIHK